MKHVREKTGYQPWGSKSYHFKAGENFASIGSSIGMSAHALTTYNLGTADTRRLGSYLSNTIGFVRISGGEKWVFDPALDRPRGRRYIYVPLTQNDRRAVTHYFFRFITQGAKDIAEDCPDEVLRGYYQQIRKNLLPHEGRLTGDRESDEFLMGAAAARSQWDHHLDAAPARLNEMILDATGLRRQAPVKVDLPRELRRSATRELLSSLQQTCVAVSRRNARCYSQCAPCANQSSTSDSQPATVRFEAG